MTRISSLMKIILAAIISASLFFAVGCEGTESRNKVDKGVEKAAGKDKVELMKKMKADVDESMEKEAERLKEIE